MSETVQFERRPPLGIVWIDNPPANALSASVRRGLARVLPEAETDSGIDRIVIACRGRSFVSGADIKEFGTPSDAPKVAEIIERVAAVSKPTFCFMHGYALGGGLELALACDWRAAEANCRLGLPEVNLGLIPGAGGTQRLPRLVGVEDALELLVTGVQIGAERAEEIGLVDDVAANGIDAYLNRLAQAPTPDKRAGKPGAREMTANEQEAITRWRERVAREMPGCDAPVACIDAVDFACRHLLCEGLSEETRLFLKLHRSPQSKALIYQFFARQKARKAQLYTRPRPDWIAVALRELPPLPHQTEIGMLESLGFSKAPGSILGEWVDANASSTGRETGRPSSDPGTDEAGIVARISLALARAGAALIEEGKAESPEVLDLAAVDHHGFPRQLGGPFHQARLLDEAGKPQDAHRERQIETVAGTRTGINDAQ